MFRNLNNYIMLAILFFALYLTGYLAYAQSYVEKQNAAHINLLENAGFESNLAKWGLVSGAVVGFLGTTSSTVALIDGKYSFHMSNSSSGEVKICSSFYDPKSLKNSNGELGFKYRHSTINNASGTVIVENASGTVLSREVLSVTALGEIREVSRLFTFTDNNARVCLLGKGTGIPYGTNLDSMWLGSPRNVTSVNQPLENVFATAQGLTWSSTASTATKIPLSATNDASKYPITNNCLKIASAGTSKYAIRISAQFYGNGEQINLGYSVNGTYKQDATAMVLPSEASGDYQQRHRTYYDDLTYGDEICAYSVISGTRTLGQGRLELQQLQPNKSTAFTGMCKDAYECEPYFTANINSSNVITSQTVTGWLTGSTGTTTKSVVFKTGLFSVPPMCFANSKAGNYTCSSYNTTTTGTDVYCTNFTSGQNGAFDLNCFRNSSDYVQKKVIQGYLSEQNLLVSYYASANKNTSTTLPIDFDTKLIDATNCNCVTTGSGWKFTAPKAGYYEISVNHILETASGAYYFIYKNGTNYAAIAYSQNAVATFGIGKRSIYLAAADYIDIRADSSRTINGGSLITSGGRAFIEVKWVGN